LTALGLRIDKVRKIRATSVLREQAKLALTDDVDPAWVGKVEQLSSLCEAGIAKTHIAFLGTAMLAKAVDFRVDLFAIKPTHDPLNPNAFSARQLCHGVLVPIAAELGISLGRSGREPLCNQPYGSMTRLDDGTPVHRGARAAFDYMMTLIRELQELPNEEAALVPLRAFLAVRREQPRRYEGAAAKISPQQLTDAIVTLVKSDSEGGKRAQAIAAGLLDGYAGGPCRIGGSNCVFPRQSCKTTQHECSYGQGCQGCLETL